MAGKVGERGGGGGGGGGGNSRKWSLGLLGSKVFIMKSSIAIFSLLFMVISLSANQIVLAVLAEYSGNFRYCGSRCKSEAKFQVKCYKH